MLVYMESLAVFFSGRKGNNSLALSSLCLSVYFKFSVMNMNELVIC